MYLFKHQNGFYYIIYKNSNNKKSRISTKSKLKSEAHKFLGEFTNQLVERKRIAHNSIELNAFIRNYSAHSESVHRPKTTESLKWVFKDFNKYLGNPLLHEITLKQIQDYLSFKRKVSVYTAQKHLAYLRSAFNYGVKHNFITKNYFKDIPNYKIPEKQMKYFSNDDYNLLIDSVKEKWFKEIIEIAIQTGLRQMEILTLRWSQIDLNNESITLNNFDYINKSKKVRMVFLTNIAKEVFQRLIQNKSCELVFCHNFKEYRQDHISKKFKKHVRRVNINQSLNFHSLRHTFASRLVQKGISLYIVQKLLGHADIKTTQVYAHLRDENLKDAIKQLNI